MPTQSIATTTAKQHSHTGTSDASAPPRRPLLEAWVIAGGVGMIASAAIVCLQGGVLASLTGVEHTSAERHHTAAVAPHRSILAEDWSAWLVAGEWGAVYCGLAQWWCTTHPCRISS